MCHTRLLLLFFLVFTFHPNLQAITIFVNKAANGSNDGSSWGNAFKELSTALPLAQHGDEIWVAKGHYLPYIEGVTNTFNMISGIELLGGFAGWEANKSQRNIAANETILRCQYMVAQNGEIFPPYNVLYATVTDSNTVIDGFLIQNMLSGPFNGEPCADDQHKCYGGGIFMYSPSPDMTTFLTINNCRFVDGNCCDAGGGAFGVNFSEGTGGFTIKNCEFDGNYAIEGGAFHIVIGTAPQLKMLVDSCSFHDNHAEFVAVGVIYNYNANIDFTVSNSIFLNNQAKNNGGVFCQSGAGKTPVKFINCKFISNFAGNIFTGQPGVGGALSGRNVYVKDCLFKKNGAFEGGAINADYLKIENSLFIDNFGTWKGGAIRCYANNCLTNCTFINNLTTYRGAGIYSGGAGISNDTIINCIFLGNKNNGESNWMSTNGANQYIANSYIDTDNCNTAIAGFQPWDTLICGANMFFNIDPMIRDTALGDYRLQGCSPLLNQGDSAWVSRLSIFRDFAGNNRWLDGVPDIGAYETQQFTATSTGQNVQCFNAANGEISLTSEGGFIPYTYTWDDGTEDDFRDHLPAGIYFVTVSDADNCADTLEVQIIQPDSLQFMATITPSNNQQSPNGSIKIVAVTGGTMPYAYNWNTGSMEQMLSGLIPGIYMVTISDHKECTTSASFEVPFVLGTIQHAPFETRIVPNPSTGLVKIIISGEDKALSIEIADMSGMVLRSQALPFKENNVSLSGLIPGVLTIIFKRHGKIIHTEKVLLR